MSTPTDGQVDFAWTIDGGPFVVPSIGRLEMAWTIVGPPLPSKIIVKTGGDLTVTPFVIKSGGVLLDPSTQEVWSP